LANGEEIFEAMKRFTHSWKTFFYRLESSEWHVRRALSSWYRRSQACRGVLERKSERTRKCQGAGPGPRDTRPHHASDRHHQCFTVHNLTSHHSVLELVSCVTLASSIKGSPGVEYADMAQVGHKAMRRAPNENTCQMQRSGNSPDCATIQSCMLFNGVFSQTPAANAFAAVTLGEHAQGVTVDRISQQNTGEHCDISPRMSRSLLWIQCTGWPWHYTQIQLSMPSTNSQRCISFPRDFEIRGAQRTRQVYAC
jgi:hypothetical protein